MSKKPTVGSDVYVVRNREIIFSDMDDETVIMSIEKGEYYGIDFVGSIIWALLEAPKTIDMLCVQLRRQFAVTEEECRQDVGEFVQALLEKELVEICEG